ncbi:MAG: SsrA-binding protein SmpB [Flavobacteriales bacterium]
MLTALIAMAIEIKNKKALYRYFLLEEFDAGMVLTGTEIKSIRAGKANITDAYCRIRQGECWVYNLYIGPYSHAGYSQHKERNERKLLLNRIEIRKIERKCKDAGITVVPTLLFISKSGYAKLRIALAKGKNVGDKRADVKEKDLRRESDRGMS